MSKTAMQWIVWTMIAFALVAVIVISTLSAKNNSAVVKKEVDCREKYAKLPIAETVLYPSENEPQRNGFIGFKVRLAQPSYCNGKLIENIFVEHSLIGSMNLSMPAYYKSHMYMLNNPKFYTYDGHNVYAYGMIAVSKIR